MEKKTKINLKKKHTQQIKLKRWSRFLALFIICLPCISILLVALSSFLYVSCVCVCKFGFFFSFFNNFNFYLFYFSPHSRDCILPFNCLVFHYRHLLPIESFPVFSLTSFYSVFFLFFLFLYPQYNCCVSTRPKCLLHLKINFDILPLKLTIT